MTGSRSGRGRAVARSPRGAVPALLAIALLAAACGQATPSIAPASGTPSSVAPSILPSPAQASASPDVSAMPTASARATESALPTASPRASGNPTGFHCTAAAGQVLGKSYRSAVTRAIERYRVYLPPCYASSKRKFPYVILLHGSLGDQREWTDTMRVAKVMDQGIKAGTLAPMILVMPAGGDLANSRIFTNGRSYESLILDELIPRVERDYATFRTRAGREIGGISRGGFWAFGIALRHPNLFAAVGGHSPFFSPINAPATSNPLDLVKTVAFTAKTRLRIWVDAGKQDYAMPGITPFVEALEDRDIDHTFQLYPTGRHEVAYWRSHIKTYMKFYGQAWPKEYEDLPARTP